MSSFKEKRNSTNPIDKNSSEIKPPSQQGVLFQDVSKSHISGGIDSDSEADYPLDFAEPGQRSTSFTKVERPSALSSRRSSFLSGVTPLRSTVTGPSPGLGLGVSLEEEADEHQNLKNLNSRLAFTTEQRRKSIAVKDRIRSVAPIRAFLPTERLEMKAGALNRWAMLKIQMDQGFFKVVEKKAIDISDISTAVEILWKDLFSHSPFGIPENEFDTSLYFLRESRSEMFNLSRQVKGRRKVVVNYLSGQSKSQNISLSTQKSIHGKKSERSFSSREWGYKGLSFDTTSSVDINNRLFAISRGIQSKDEVYASKAPSVQDQIIYNRGWKLLVVGLTQADAFSRYEAMTDLGRALGTIMDTLNDNHARLELVDCLLQISSSDERLENRVKAIYLLGQFAIAVANAEECLQSLKKIFRRLAEMILAIQVTRDEAAPSLLFNDIRVHLFRSLGKFSSIKFPNMREFESIIIFLSHNELRYLFLHQNVHNPLHNDLFVLLSILESLGTYVLQTNDNIVFMGALFLDFLDLIMAHATHIDAKKIAIYFTSKWLPIKSEEALLTGLDCLIMGLNHCKDFFGVIFPEERYESWMNRLLERLHHEEFKSSLRAKIMRSLIQAPGTVSTMLHVPGYSGFFCDIQSSMRNTESLLVELPIHGKSNVTLTRPIPPIPGVPSGTTTTPPLFVIGENWVDSRPPPKSEYEYKERIGVIPQIPPGFTSNPFGVLLGKQTPVIRDENSPVEPLGMYKVNRNAEEWSDSDEIPKGASRVPPRPESAGEKLQISNIPSGFTSLCPYSGFDPEKIDHSIVPISAVYGRSSDSFRPLSRDFNSKAATLLAEKGQYQDYACIGAKFADKDSYTIPDEYTLNRHTPLFPCKLPGITENEPKQDFFIGAPVIIDIIQPQKPQLQRIFCIVHSLDEDSSAIVVQKALNDVNGMYPGSIFNLYIKPRNSTDDSKWVTIQLKVIDDNYDDGIDFSTPNQIIPLESRRKKASQASKKPDFFPSFSEIFQYPYPSGYNTNGEPFFSPSINMPSYPSGYNAYGFPFFGKSQSIKPTPIGITPSGSRYYASLKNDTNLPKNQLAGYDSEGNPFFIPRGFTLPQPSGFTIDGIPFYDIPSLVRQQGEFTLPSLFSRLPKVTPNENDPWQDTLYYFQKSSAKGNRRFELYFQQQLITHFTKCITGIRQNLLRARNRLINPFATKMSATAIQFYTPPSDFSVSDPENISRFLREAICFSHLKPHPIKLMLEPSTAVFQSNKSAIVKSIALRHKAGRGDHTERDVFLSVEPSGIFSIKEFQLTLQGEGFQEINVSFYPMAMKKPIVHGGLHVFDRHGKRMFSASLTASKRSFFSASPSIVDLGWVSINKSKESFLSIENLADYQFNVTFHMGVNSDKFNPFSLPNDFATLRPLETVKILVSFKPKESGRVSIPLKMVGPGGETSFVILQGTTEMPMTIYSEPTYSSNYDISLLSRERTLLVRKFNTMGDKDFLSFKEKEFISRINAAQKDQKINVDFHTLDYGICLPIEKTSTRYITAMNWSNQSIICGLYSHDKCVTCPRVVKVAANSAVTFEVSFSHFFSKVKGNYTSLIEVSCQDLDNIAIQVKAYIGYPVYMPVWENIFFPPTNLQKTVYLPTHIVNDSFYDVRCYFEGFDAPNENDSHGFGLLEGATNSEKFITLPAFSVTLLTLTFKPSRLGVISKEISLRVIAPTQLKLPLVLREKELTLFGICFQTRNPTVDNKLPQFVQKILHWLSQPKSLASRIDDVKDDSGDELSVNASSCLFEVCFKNDTFIPEIIADFNAIPQILASQNKSDSSFKVHYFASPYLTLEPKFKEVIPGELSKLDLYFSPPPNASNLATLHGFVTVMDQATIASHSIQVLKRMGVGFLILPLANHSEGQIVFDFGKVELNGENSTECIRHLVLSNPYNNKYSWSIKQSPSSKKVTVFNFSVLHGKLEKMETVTIPITFKTDVSGAFESKCEIFADPPDQLAKSIKMGTIILKGIASSSIIEGVPESIDFGSTIVNHTTTKKINLLNAGNQEIDLTILVKPPFFISPHKCVIPAKSNQYLDISFCPQEHKQVDSKFILFANYHLHVVKLSGLGGNAELVCEDPQEGPLDFGLLSDGTIAFADVFFTNKGSIPLEIAAIFSETPTKIRLEYKGIISARSKKEGSRKIIVRKDFWRTVKNMVKSFRFFPNERLTNFRRFAAEDVVSLMLPESISKNIQISSLDSLGLSNNTNGRLPILPALSSYHFRLGYPVSCSDPKDREVTFSYMPLSDEMGAVEENLLSSMTLEMTGEVYIPLEIAPYFLNFDNTPAESFASNESYLRMTKYLDYGVTRKVAGAKSGPCIPLEINNKAFDSQDIWLESISSGFYIDGKRWTIEGNSSIEVIVEFHPPREQTRYDGNAVFRHQFGIIIIRLFGTGSSADIVADELIDFGTLRLNSGGRKMFQMHNRGILGTHFELDIVQKLNEFSLLDGDPFETQGFIAPGKTIRKEIACKCQSKTGAFGEIIVRWKKVPNGKTEICSVPMKLEIGFPEFKVHTTALDFASTFIGIDKTLSLGILNEGDASCNWIGESDHQAISMDKTSGILFPGESDTIRIKYSPSEFAILDSSLSFNTDAGYFKVVCFGVVGVPLLKIMNETKIVDFKVVTIGKYHSMFLDIVNSGKQNMDFELELIEMSRDLKPLKFEEFEHFFIEPMKGTIKSGDAFPLKVTTFPKDYAVVYEGKILIRGSSGEEHIFYVKAVGGQAIIKIKPPKPTVAGSKISSQMPDYNAKQSINPKDKIVGQSTAMQQVLKSHIDTLYEVLGGLKSADEEINHALKLDLPPTFPSVKTSSKTSSLSKPPSPQKIASHNSRSKILSSDIEDVINFEKEIESAMAKLDPTGQYSRITPPSRGKTPDCGLLPPISFSRPASREYGGYKPGRTATASGNSNDPLLLNSRAGTPAGKKSALDKSNDVELAKQCKILPPLVANFFPEKSELANSVFNFENPESTSIDNSPLNPLQSQTPLKGQQPSKNDYLSLRRDFSPPQPGIIPQDEISFGTKLMVSASLSENSSDVKKMLVMAEKLGLSLDPSAEGLQNLEDLKSTLFKFLKTTKNTMKTVKEKILNESWVPNRDLLHQAMRKLQISQFAIEEIFLTPAIESVPLEENFYSLDIVCGGERSPSTLLFNIPNEGNIPFNFKIFEKKDDFSYPEDAKAALPDFFSLETSEGLLEPGESVNISVTFFGLIPGSYRQGYILKSGDDEILSFAIGAAVGNPILEFSLDTIDFGLLGKGQTSDKQISIKNIGTFEGSWEIDIDSEFSCFKALPLAGKTDKGSLTYCNVSFSPPGEGVFEATVKLQWKGGPTLLKLVGTGGAPKLEFTYHALEDKSSKGLDFGKCALNSKYEHLITITNTGSMEAIVQLAHPNPCLYFNVQRNDLGEIKLLPGESTILTVVYIPEKIEKLSNSIVFTLINAKNSTQTVFVKGRSGTEIMESFGFLDFLNIPLDEWQQKILKFKNSGTFDLPFKFEFEPKNLEDNFLVDLEEDCNSSTILAGNELVLTIKPVPTVTYEIKGEFVASTTLYGSLKEFRFPFMFKVYSEEIAALISEPVSVGRVVPGQTAQTEQIIVNNSNKKIEYRAKILNADGIGESIDWVLADDNATGVINPNEQVMITAMFNAVKGRGDRWQNATLIIEKLDQSKGGWSVFSEVSLKGGLGEAKFNLEPDTISFEEVAIGEMKQARFMIKNPGTAPCNYDISPLWKNNNIFVIDQASPLQGSVPPDDGVVEFIVNYKPESEGYCDTEIQVVTPVATKSIFISGSGQIFRLYSKALPNMMDFKQIHFGALGEYELLIENGSRLEMVLSGSFEGNFSHFLKYSPLSIKMKANENDYERSNVIMNISCGLQLECELNGLPKEDQFRLINYSEIYHSKFSILGNEGSLILAQIPLSFSFLLRPVTLHSTNSDFDNIKTLPSLTTISFGKVGLELGDIKYFMLYNHNQFRVQYNIRLESSSEPRFKLSIDCLTINPESYEEFHIELLPINMDQYPNGFPKKISCEGSLIITPWTSHLPSINVPVAGTLSDNEEGLKIDSEISFGSIFKNRISSKSLPIKNSSVRSVQWKLSIEKDFEDVFYFNPPLHGVLAPRSSIDVILNFCPKIGVTYNTAAYLETNDDTSTIMLVGHGVDPKLKSIEEAFDFGIVGVTAPEYRDIPLTNPTKLPMKVRIVSDNPYFLPANAEVILMPGETIPLRIVFRPSDDDTASKQVANISVILLESSLGDFENIEPGKESGRPLSSAKELDTLNIFRVEGRGGNFDFEIDGSDVEEVENLDSGEFMTSSMNVQEIQQEQQFQESQQTQQVPQAQQVQQTQQGQEVGSSTSLSNSLSNSLPNSRPNSRPSSRPISQQSRKASLQSSMPQTQNQQNIELTNIIIKYGKVQKLQKVKKSFDVENSGAAPLDFFVESLSGESFTGSGVYQSKDMRFNYSIYPTECNIMPNSKIKITVVLEGVLDGEDFTDFLVVTRSLMQNRGIRVRVLAQIFTQSEIEHIKSFLRADENLDTRYDLIRQEERLAIGDLQLWKVLAPILRINKLLPSQELQYIPPIEPNISLIDMQPFVIRPPAIPEPLVAKGKKIANRTSMNVDHQSKTNSFEILSEKSLKEQRREGVIEFLANSNVEKMILLDKKKK